MIDIHEIGRKELTELGVGEIARILSIVVNAIDGKECTWEPRRPEYLRGKDFYKITAEDIVNADIRGCGKGIAKKIIWLQKHLSGEMEEAYTETHEQFSEEVENAQLKYQLDELKRANKSLKMRNTELLRQIELYEKREEEIAKKEKRLDDISDKLRRFADKIVISG